MNEMKPKHI